MRRLRRLAIVLVAIGLVTSAVYATGAFSSLSTSRDANVHVAGDKAGYLGLAPGENGEYTTYQNGKLQLQLNGALEGKDAPTGGGVNRDARTELTDVFTITNQGAQSVGVWLEDTDDYIAFERASGGSLEGQGNAVELAPGDTVHVGLTIDTTETDADQLDTQLIINADSDVEGTNAGTGSENSEGTQLPASSSTPEEDELSNGNDDSDDSSDEDKYENCDKWKVLIGKPCYKQTSESDAIDATVEVLDETTEPAQKEVGEATEPIREPIEEKFNSREELIQELTADIENVIDFLEEHPKISAVLMWQNPLTISAWAYMHPEEATSLVLGVLLGEAGIPGGKAEVSQSDSVFYLVGWLAPGFIPEVGAVFDGRDLAHSAWNLNGEGIALNSLAVASSIKGVGIGNVLKAGGGLTKWIAKVGGRAGSPAANALKADALDAVGKYIVPHTLESSRLSGRQNSAFIETSTITLLDRLSDGGASKMLDNGAPMDAVAKSAKAGDLKKNGEVTKRVGYEEMKTLQRMELSGAEKMEFVKRGHDITAVGNLMDNGLSAGRAHTFAERGIDFTRAEELRSMDGVTIDNIRRLGDEGANFKKAKTAHGEDVPIGHVEYYIKNGNDLDEVIAARETGRSATFIKKVYQFKNSKKTVENKAKAIDWKKKGKVGLALSGYYAAAHNYCTWQSQEHADEDWKFSKTCRALPSQP